MFRNKRIEKKLFSDSRSICRPVHFSHQERKLVDILYFVLRLKTHVFLPPSLQRPGDGKRVFFPKEKCSSNPEGSVQGSELRDQGSR